jgi:hypothetical protein
MPLILCPYHPLVLSLILFLSLLLLLLLGVLFQHLLQWMSRWVHGQLLLLGLDLVEEPLLHHLKGLGLVEEPLLHHLEEISLSKLCLLLLRLPFVPLMLFMHILRPLIILFLRFFLLPPNQALLCHLLQQRENLPLPQKEKEVKVLLQHLYLQQKD